MKTKLKFLTAVIIMSLPVFMCAQDFDKLNFGAQVSPTISWLSSSHAKVLGGGPDIGLKIGAVGEFAFAKNYYFTAGIGFGLNQGGKLQFPEGGDVLPKSQLSDAVSQDIRHDLPKDTKVDYRIKYLEIPIGLKLRTNEYGYVRYFGEIPIITLSAVTGAKGSINAANLDVNKENIRKDVNTLNAQWGLGGGMEYYFSESNALIIGIYYHQGFFDITSKRPVTEGKEINHTIALRLGILF